MISWFKALLKKVKALFNPHQRQNNIERNELKSVIDQVKSLPKVTLKLKKLLEYKIYIEDYIINHHSQSIGAQMLESQVDEICQVACENGQTISQISEKLKNQFEIKKVENELDSLKQKSNEVQLKDSQKQKMNILEDRLIYLKEIEKTQDTLIEELDLAEVTLENLKLQIDQLLSHDHISLSKPLSSLTHDLFEKMNETKTLKQKIGQFLRQ